MGTCGMAVVTEGVLSEEIDLSWSSMWSACQGALYANPLLEV